MINRKCSKYIPTAEFQMALAGATFVSKGKAARVARVCLRTLSANWGYLSGMDPALRSQLQEYISDFNEEANYVEVGHTT